MGRIATGVMVLIALAWIPVIKSADGLYNYLQAVQGYLAPPIFVVFFFGVFFKRLNAKGCFWAMVVGFILGVFRMLVDTPGDAGPVRQDPTDGHRLPEGSFLWIVNNINFQYFSVLITLVSAVVMVVVSYLTTAPEYEQIQGLTFGTVTDEHRQQSRSSWNWIDVLASLGIVAAIVGDLTSAAEIQRSGARMGPSEERSGFLTGLVRLLRGRPVSAVLTEFALQKNTAETDGLRVASYCPASTRASQLSPATAFRNACHRSSRT